VWLALRLHSKHPSCIIDGFRQSHTQWIVSVGMISEGTDIPRLQVCCHLSRIKTEMHYRQVLGRILRVNSDEAQQAWLFTLAETSLTEFAYRIDQDLPEQSVVIEQTGSQDLDLELPQLTSSEATQGNIGNELHVDLSGFSLSNTNGHASASHKSAIDEENSYNLALLGSYKEQIVRMFDNYLLSS